MYNLNGILFPVRFGLVLFYPRIWIHVYGMFMQSSIGYVLYDVSVINLLQLR
jgi:hypothetical protein